MSKRRKALIACAFACIAGLAIGIVVGAEMGRTVGQLMLEMKLIASQTAVSNFSSVQFTHADAEHAREAVLLEIKTVRELREAGSNWPDFLPLAYGRLAVAEEKLGDHEGEQKAFDAFRQLTKKSRPNKPDLTDAEIKQFVTKLGRFSF